MRVTDSAAAAAEALRRGGLAVLPTETVYGLGALADDPAAVARVYAVKGRPADHPLIVHLASAAGLTVWGRAVPAYAEALAHTLWPGPLTLVVRRSSRVGDAVTGGQDTVGLRVPAHPGALEVLRLLDESDPGRAPHGVAAPSANRFGRVSPTTVGHVLDELGGLLDPDLDVVLEGGPCTVGVESTIVDCTGERPRILRPGAVSAAQIERVGGVPVRVGGVPGGGPGEGPDGGEGSQARRARDADDIRAPGMLASHYAPNARVIVVAAPGDLAQALHNHSRGESGPIPRPRGDEGPIMSPLPPRSPDVPRVTTGLLATADIPTPDGVVRLAMPADARAYARVLYAALREADAVQLDTVVAVLPAAGSDGAAEAVADRLRRAATQS